MCFVATAICLDMLFIEQFKPRFHLYGHVHMDYGDIDRVIMHPSGTTLINCYGMYMMELR